MFRFKGACLFLLMSMVLLGTGCSEATHKINKVVVTYATGQINVPTHVEKRRGALKEKFDDLGLEMEYSNISNGADQIVALESGDIQILNGVGGSSVIMAAANGSDIVILSMYSNAPKTFAMFSNDESLNSPESLKGLTIAGPKGTNLHELLTAYLRQKNMTISDVDFINMDIPSAVAALKAGTVDVALVGGIAAYNMEKSGAHKICDGMGLISATVVTATSRKFATENPDIIDAFLNTQKEVVEDIIAHTEECLEIAAEETNLDIDTVTDIYQNFDYNVMLTVEDVELLQSTEEFLLESGMIEEHLDVSKLIYHTEKGLIH